MDAPARHRIGRIAIDLPRELKRVGQRHLVRLVTLAEEPWPSAAIRAEAFDAAFAARAARFPGAHEERALAPGRRALLHAARPGDAQRLCVELLCDVGAIGVWLAKSGRQSAHALLADVAELADALVPLTRDGSDGRDGFWLEHSRVALPYRGQEQAEVRFAGHAAVRALMVQTRAQKRVEVRRLLERVDEAFRAPQLADVTRNVERLRARERTIAGVSGDEVVTRAKAGAEIDFHWEALGEPDSGARPWVEVSMSAALPADDEGLDALFSLWDAALAGLRPRG